MCAGVQNFCQGCGLTSTQRRRGDAGRWNAAGATMGPTIRRVMQTPVNTSRWCKDNDGAPHTHAGWIPAHAHRRLLRHVGPIYAGHMNNGEKTTGSDMGCRGGWQECGPRRRCLQEGGKKLEAGIRTVHAHNAQPQTVSRTYTTVPRQERLQRRAARCRSHGNGDEACNKQIEPMLQPQTLTAEWRERATTLRCAH